MIGSGLGFGGDSAGLAHGVEVDVGRHRDTKFPPTCGPCNGVINDPGPFPVLPTPTPSLSDTPWGSHSGACLHEVCLYRRATVHQITLGKRLGRATACHPPPQSPLGGRDGKGLLSLPQEAPPPHDVGGKRMTGKHPSLFISLTNLQTISGVWGQWERVILLVVL